MDSPSLAETPPENRLDVQAGDRLPAVGWNKLLVKAIHLWQKYHLTTGLQMVLQIGHHQLHWALQKLMTNAHSSWVVWVKDHNKHPSSAETTCCQWHLSTGACKGFECFHSSGFIKALLLKWWVVVLSLATDNFHLWGNHGWACSRMRATYWC